MSCVPVHCREARTSAPQLVQPPTYFSHLVSILGTKFDHNMWHPGSSPSSTLWYHKRTRILWYHQLITSAQTDLVWNNQIERQCLIYAIANDSMLQAMAKYGHQPHNSFVWWSGSAFLFSDGRNHLSQFSSSPRQHNNVGRHQHGIDNNTVSPTMDIPLGVIWWNHFLFLWLCEGHLLWDSRSRCNDDNSFEHLCLFTWRLISLYLNTCWN